jgi:hypothetical protein
LLHPFCRLCPDFFEISWHPLSAFYVQKFFFLFVHVVDPHHVVVLQEINLGKKKGDGKKRKRRRWLREKKKGHDPPHGEPA